MNIRMVGDAAFAYTYLVPASNTAEGLMVRGTGGERIREDLHGR